MSSIVMKVTKALGLFSEKYKDPSACGSCGAEFTCGATLKGCWCMKVELSSEIRKELESNFKDCLCQKCLEKFAEK